MCRYLLFSLSLTLASLLSYWGPRVHHIDPAELERPQIPWPLSTYHETFSDNYAAEKLTVDSAVHAAAELNRLSDFGDEGMFPFREGLKRLIEDATDASNNMSACGASHLKEVVLRALTNRLKIENLIKQHPEILDEEIDRPIWIIGTPRSAASHLHRLLAHHSRFRAPLLYEMMEPVLSEVDTRALTRNGFDGRVARCKKHTDVLHMLRPKLNMMHMDEAEDPVDEAMATLPMFQSAHFGLTIPLQRYTKWYLAQSKTQEFSYLRIVLQVLQWQDHQQGKPRKRWVMKAQSHTIHIPFLVRVFPTAELVHLHRDPIAVMPAYLTYIAYSQGLFASRLDLKAMGKLFEAAFDTFLHKSVSVRHYNQDFKTTDIYFDDLVKNSSQVAKQVLDFADEEPNEKDLLPMTSFAAEHRRYRDGHLDYDLTTFGLQEEPLRKKFDFYRDHFRISREAVKESGRILEHDEL